MEFCAGGNWSSKEKKKQSCKSHLKKIAHARKEHDNDGKGKRQDEPKLHHKRCHGSGKCHQGKEKKLYDYHALCYHDMEECDF
eukprot:15332857-Ditylum_brightwellii.AAC.1